MHILLRFDDRTVSRQRALDEIKRVIPVHCWSELSHSHFGELKAIHRVAAAVEDGPLKRTLAAFARSEMTEEAPVRALVQCHGQMHSFNNSFDGHGGGGHLVAELMAECEHRLDTSSYPEMPQHLARKLLRNHAEKKALAFLLEQSSQDLVVNVNMRMCADCHRFYAAVSKRVTSRLIVCNDRHSQHRFQNGECSCGLPYSDLKNVNRDMGKSKLTTSCFVPFSRSMFAWLKATGAIMDGIMCEIYNCTFDFAF